jgi:hypothetical protein
MRGPLDAALISSLFLLMGCQGRLPDTASKLLGPTTLEVVVEADEEHLGHSIDESGGHSVWCEGLRARLLPSDEVLMIYSINNPFGKSAHRLEKGHRYQVRFTGELGTGIMSYDGKCLDLAQITQVVEIDRSANR